MKIYQSCILILTLFLCTFSLIAQQKEITFSVGSNYGYFKDSNFSPLNYRQKGKTYAIAYHKQNRNGTIWGIQANFSPTILSTRTADYFSSAYLQGALSFDYLKKWKLSNNNHSLHIGGQLMTNDQLVDFDGLQSFTYLFAHSLNLKGIYNYTINDRHHLQSSLSIPVVAYTVRPPHNGFDKTTEENEKSPLKLISVDGKWTSLNTYIAADWTLQYRYATSGRVDLSLGYQLTYQREKDLHHLFRLTNQVSIGAIIKL